jgi:hypothetical protein
MIETTIDTHQANTVHLNHAIIFRVYRGFEFCLLKLKNKKIKYQFRYIIFVTVKSFVFLLCCVRELELRKSRG